MCLGQVLAPHSGRQPVTAPGRVSGSKDRIGLPTGQRPATLTVNAHGMTAGAPPVPGVTFMPSFVSKRAGAPVLVAQWTEHPPPKRSVMGSNPILDA